MPDTHARLDSSSSSSPSSPTPPPLQVVPSDPPLLHPFTPDLTQQDQKLNHNHLSGDHAPLADTQHNHQPPASPSPSHNQPPSDQHDPMIAVQHSPTVERGSYFDHEDEADETIHPTAASRLSATVSQLINPFRIFNSTTAEQSSMSQVPSGSSQPQSDDRPPVIQPFPTQSTFTFPQVSPPTSPLPSGPPSRRSRPSLEGVFNPTPRETREIKNLPSNASSKNSASANVKRLSHSTSSSNSSRPSSKRPVPQGENPLIFGNVNPRRIAKSVPIQPGPSIDTTLLSQTGTVRAPALSVTSATPQPSPSRPISSQGLLSETTGHSPDNTVRLSGSLRKPGTGNSPPKTVTYEDQVRLSGSSKSKGKRKSEELDTTTSSAHANGVLCDEEGRLDKGRSRRGSEPLSNSSSTAGSNNPPPSAFSPSQRNSKRIKLNPAGAESGATRPDSPSTIRDPSIRPSRPSSKASRRPPSHFNASQGSLPLSAIVSPRPPSIVASDYYGRREEGLYMRDPRREWENMNVGWSPTSTGEDDIKPPRSAILFYLGFLLPLLWFVGALLRNESLSKSSDRSSTDEKTTEKPRKWDHHVWQISQRRNKVYKTWRDRNRFMALVSIITYVPIIVCLAVFIPR